jgi:LuxR family transcriptional regulator, quorum-sensing system regulator SolR
MTSERSMSLTLLCDAFEAMERAATADELRTEMHRFANSMGFEHFAYALTVNTPSFKPQQYFLSGYPPRWLERYLALDYFKEDPIVRHAESSTLPALWGDQRFHARASAGFWEEARSFGLSAGVSFAVHEQPAATGIFSLARDRSLDLPPAELAALVGRAQIFASLLHHAVSRIDLPRLLPGQDITLTAREKECLKWAAEGKTAWEIGQILSISERTAVFHLNNMMQKLGASNRTQSIVRAVALKLF